MSYINEIEFDFEVGDAYELSPIEMLYVVGKVREQGGQVYIDGTTLIITEMPGKTARPVPVPAPVEAAPVEAEEVPAPVEPEPAPEPEPEPEVVEIEEASVEVDETPIKRARKTAAKTEETPATVSDDASDKE